MEMKWISFPFQKEIALSKLEQIGQLNNIINAFFKKKYLMMNSPVHEQKRSGMPEL